ncbi:MAG: hypothetical protein IT443_13825 [Phycisphaeraceae bacterium]|nr:hypothetical protein [Phycisphaeraceae bacterium]
MRLERKVTGLANERDNFRWQIAQCAYLNAQVIQDALEDGNLGRSLAKWTTHYGIPNWNLKNPAYIASLLYCLIVVPKEIWDPPSNDTIYNLLDKDKPLRLFQVTTWAPPNNEHPLRDFIRHLRNAIAHVNFASDSQENYEFWDKSRNGTENFKVSITVDALGRFLSTVGAQLANLRSR